MPPTEASPTIPILDAGRNCQRVCRASRAAVLVDAATHFAAVVAAMRQARRSVLIAGWDFDSRVPLLREEGRAPDPEVRLGRFLDAVAEARPELEIHVLAWDFPVLYALERQPLPIFNLGWRTHRRVHFHLDDEHPFGASHHQKLIVVDDRVAFCGGIDLTQRRWDVSEHRADDPRRTDPGGERYGPFHDASLLVDGEAAACLGALLRERWLRAKNQALPAREVPAGHDPWPSQVEPTFTDVPVGIARTDPPFRGRPGVREVERLYLDAIAAARSTIYVENQYLTAPVIGDALAARLSEPEGPEVVLVINLISSGWLEESTMDAMRGRIVSRLQAADAHGRLRVLCPVVPGADGDEVNLKVHAKIMVVDDLLLRVGSSNLNNRSMGLDTECDLALAAPDPAAREAVRGLRDRLLAEHLGVAPRDVQAVVEETGSLIGGIERLNTGGRGLRSLPEKAGAIDHLIVPDQDLVDPEQPVELDQLIDDMLHEEPQSQAAFRWAWLLRGGLLIAFALAMAAAWRFTPLRDVVDREALVTWVGAVRASPFEPLWVIGAYMLLGLSMFPITVLIGATAVVFDLLPSIGYALAGSLLSAVIAFGLGQVLGRDLMRRVGGRRLNRLSRRLAQSGLAAVMVVRVLPVAPFTVVNLVAGATHIRLRDFALGTVLGMLPGVVGVSLVVNQVKHLVLEPSVFNLLLLASIALVVIVAGTWLARRARRGPGAPPTVADDSPEDDAPRDDAA